MNNDLLTFNGKNIVFRRIKGQYWIAIKSVCEALNVNYNRQYQNIQADPILGPAFANLQMQLPDDQVRKMSCLPEHLVYGWIFSIKSNSDVLLQYKKECYEVLFNYFHGTITKRSEIYTSIVKEKRKIKDLETKLIQNQDYNDFLTAKMKEARLWKKLRDDSDMNDLFEDEQMVL